MTFRPNPLEIACLIVGLVVSIIVLVMPGANIVLAAVGGVLIGLGVPIPERK